MKGLHKRILASFVFVAIIAVLGLMARQFASLEWLVTQESELRFRIQSSPAVAWLIGFLVCLCLSLIPGTSGKSVIFGWLYGFWMALLLVDFALTAAAVVTFFASRFLFRETIEARFGMHLIRLRKKLEADAAFYLLMLRLLHTPFSFVNYSAGATNVVSPFTFWWTTQLGMLPGTIIFVFAGTRIPSLSLVAEHGPLALLDPLLFAALLATGLLPLLFRMSAKVIRRWWSRRHEDCNSAGDITFTER